jgi:predicted  nucleic acid-binding Zn-ribbon protein
MSEIIEELLKLYAIDQELIKLKKRMDAGPQEIQEQENRVAASRDACREAETVIKHRAGDMDRIALDIRTCEAEIDDMDGKLSIIKNNKEYKIITSRIKDLKQRIVQCEDEQLRLMEELDLKRASLKESQASLSAAEEKLSALKAEVATEAEEIRAKSRDLKESRDRQIESVKTVDELAMEIYLAAFRRGYGDAMAQMRVDGICQTCFRKQSANIENIVLVGRDLKQCRCAGCGRLLYSGN